MPDAPPTIQTRRLGRTGHLSSLAILGGAAFWDSSPERTETAFRAALDSGINHLDVAPQYGRAQELLGPFIPPVRDRLFVACKTLRHGDRGTRAQLEESLSLLECDTFDLYQLHAVNDIDELDRREGAVRAILAARDEGLCRFVGITGHEHSAPAAHLEALRRYDLDTVMFPVNARLWSDPRYRADAEALLSHCAEHDVGVMAIKSAAARPWGERPHTATTWYEPYAESENIEQSLRFTLSVPGVHALCTPGDLDLLRLVLECVGNFTPMEPGERASLMLDRSGEASIFPMPHP